MSTAFWYTLGIVLLALALYTLWKALVLGLFLLGLLWTFTKIALVAAAIWYGGKWLYKKLLA